MTSFAHALSELPDSREGALAAARDAHAQLAGAPATALFVFSTDTHDAGVVLAAVREVFGAVPTAGCSAPAVFARGVVTRTGVGVLAAAGTGLTLSPAAVDGVATAGEQAGAEATERALAGLEAAGLPTGGEQAVVLLLSDGVVGNSVEVVRGVVDVVGRETRVVGGGAGDDFKFARAQQFCNDEVHSGSALAVGLASDGPIGTALRHGCRPWGPPMQATEVNGRELKGLDFAAAFDRYNAVAEQLGTQGPAPKDFVQFAMLHPLGLVQSQGDHVLRSPIGLGEHGVVHCCSDIPANAVLRVMEGDPESLLAAAREAGAAAKAQLGGRAAAGALVFACISRDPVLGADAHGASLELRAVQEGLGEGVPLVGCLTFGGFGALSGGLPQYHSKSVNVCAFGSTAL